MGLELGDQAEHRPHCDRAHCRRAAPSAPADNGPFVVPYDDGNGLWITQGETPSDLG